MHVKCLEECTAQRQCLGMLLVVNVIVILINVTNDGLQDTPLSFLLPSWWIRVCIADFGSPSWV